MKTIVFMACILLSLHVGANTTVESLMIHDRSILKSLFDDFSEAHETPWDNWGITEKEWERYENIVEKTAWSHWEGEASPLQILAIYSSSLEEKKRFARIEAKLDTWREDKVLEYQSIYNSERSIVHAKYAAYLAHRRPVVENLRTNDQVLFFTQKGKCNLRCKTLLNRLNGQGVKIDVYMIDADEEGAVFSWAMDAGIDVDRVKTKQVTLNFDEGLFQSISDVPPSFATLPVVYFKNSAGAFVRIAL